MEIQSDENLVAELAEGQSQALTVLMERYQNDINRFCLHYLRDVERAQELTQETFIRVYTACDRFDDTRKFRPWVLCIARNLCLNELKRRKTVPMQSLDAYVERAGVGSAEVLRSTDAGPDDEVMAAERLSVLTEALGTLSEEAREIVTLRFFQRMSAREIADIVGSTEGAVRTKLHRILSSLRQRYEKLREDL